MINLTIDGKAVSVPKGTTVFTAAKQLGLDIPVFCYHDRMPPFGACRVCLVEVDKMARPQTSCTLEASEGMVVRTQSSMAVTERNHILEFLLLNHPLDCPVCDRGGECPLQEHVFSHGPGLSRFFEEKRHFKKALPLGPVLMLDRERCIVCARCTRFGDLVAGDHALEMLERNYKTEVGTPGGRPAESKFIGNTIMLCPVGALTSQVYRFRARPWDNESTESTCTLCPVGCSMIFDSRDGQLMRSRSKENREVNDLWLCDKGWFGYEFTSHLDRLKQPLVRRSNEWAPIGWPEAISLIAEKIRDAKSSGRLAGFGGNPLTVEENYYFQKLMREGAGVNHVDHRIGMPLVDASEEGIAPGMVTSMHECEELSFIFLLGLDLTEEFPVIWLRLRQAINRGAVTLFMGHYAPEIASHLSQTILHAPGSELQVLIEQFPYMADLAKTGKKGAIFVGQQYLNTHERRSILSQLSLFTEANPSVMLNVMEGRGNSMGARAAGMHPDFGPLGDCLVTPGLNSFEVLEQAATTGWDFLYVAGANPARKFPSNLWKRASAKIGFLVVQDLFLTETAECADLILPSLTYVEKGGSFLNIEGRVQSLMPGKEIPEGIYSDADIFSMVAQQLNVSLSLPQEFSDQLRSGWIRPVKRSFVKAPEKSVKSVATVAGELLATFAPALFDEGVRIEHDPHVAELVKEPHARVHPEEAAKRGLVEGSRVRLNALGNANGNTVQAKIKCDPQVSIGTIVLPLGFQEIRVHDLDMHLVNGIQIQIQKE